MNCLLVVLALLCVYQVNAGLPILRDLGKAKNKIIGTEGFYSGITGSDRNYTNILGTQYGSITPENELKWSATEPNRGSFTYSQGDAIVNFAKQHNQVVRGHNLVWGQYNPNWLTNGGFSASQKQDILKTHISNVAGHYKGQLYAWDVVNEAVNDNGNGLKSNVWYPSVSNYIDLAFQYAYAADGNTKLFYNDYSSEGLSAKANYIYDLVRSAKNRGIPIHGVGLQAHFSLGYAPSMNDIASNIKRLGDLGLEVHITELDVSYDGGSGNDQNKAQAQATVYSNLLKVCIAAPSCTHFISWGFTDKYTWLGSGKKPLPFDENYNNKPAFDALAAALR